MKLGKAIAKIRKDNKLTQEDFAKKFNVTRQTISNWENEKSYPDLATLVRISDEFGVSLDYLIKDDTEVVTQMNEEIVKGRKFDTVYKNSMIKLVIAIIGIICCTVLWVMSLIDFDGIAKPIIWLAVILFCTNEIAECLKIRKLKKNND